MIKIGLTGGIGVGKTYVAKIFQKLGIPVFNSDKHAKLCLMNDLNLKKNIENQFGKDIYFNGVLQRKRLAEIVFNDTDAQGDEEVGVMKIVNGSNAPTSIKNIFKNQNKNIIKILDFLGREVSFKFNKPLFYFFDDDVMAAFAHLG